MLAPTAIRLGITLPDTGLPTLASFLGPPGDGIASLEEYWTASRGTTISGSNLGADAVSDWLGARGHHATQGTEARRLALGPSRGDDVLVCNAASQTALATPLVRRPAAGALFASVQTIPNLEVGAAQAIIGDFDGGVVLGRYPGGRVAAAIGVYDQFNVLSPTGLVGLDARVIYGVTWEADGSGGTTARLYLGQDVVATQTAPAVAGNPGTLAIGAGTYQGQPAASLDGYISGVAVFSSLPTAADIAAVVARMEVEMPG